LVMSEGLLLSKRRLFQLLKTYKRNMKALFISFILFNFALELNAQTNAAVQNKGKMKVAVWDTYVTRKDGKIMHFDIIAPEEIKDTAVIYKYGREYLKSKGQEHQPLGSKQCRLCHVRQLQPQWEEAIRKNGYYIFELENCN
jgi:hypothetical protein